MNDKRNGKVVRIDIELGIGIIVDENGQDIHFHIGTASEGIMVDSTVNFEIQLTEKGLSATDVVAENEKSRLSFCSL